MRPIALLALAALIAPVAAEETLRPVPETEVQPQGALSDTSIFVSAGHGWHNLNEAGRWVTQRGLVNGIIEDHTNAEIVNQYLLPYLWNSGARVYTTRERDMNTNMVIVEPTGEGFSMEGRWVWERNARAYKGSQLRVGASAEDITARAVYTPNIPEEGSYAVYYWYAPSTNRKNATDARIRINHAGGSVVWTQDLNRDAGTWKYLGHYYFDEGTSAANGTVIVENISGDPEANIVAGTVRFGGGMGDIVSNGTISGKPRWEESGYYYAQFAGYDPAQDTRTYNTVSAMPMWAEWEAEDWEAGKTVYISWHSNASGSGAGGRSRGFFSFVYGAESWGPLTDFIGFPGGVELVVSTHDAIMADVHSTFDPEWRNGSKVTRWLGETNPRNNNRMPAVVLEYGFFDNVEDAAYLVEPAFRTSVARGTYAGLVHYYADFIKGFENRTILPEPPESFSAEILADGAVRLSWKPGPTDQDFAAVGSAPTEYRLYRSTHGRAFDNGALTNETSVTLRSLEPGQTYFFRVAARNAGGESLPTETLTVRLDEKPRVLLVNGFDRMDAGLNEDIGGYKRGIVDKMNRRNYLIEHARALEALGHAFDSTSNEALTAERLSPQKYDAVIWALGREKGKTEALGANEQKMLADYLAAGGALFLTGSDFAEDLSATEEGKQFLRDVLKVDFIRPSAGVYTALTDSGLLLNSEQILRLDDGTGHAYDARDLDVIAPRDGAEGILYFDADLRVPGGISYAGTGRHVALTVPFETIIGEEARRNVMQDVLAFLLQSDTIAMVTEETP